MIATKIKSLLHPGREHLRILQFKSEHLGKYRPEKLSPNSPVRGSLVENLRSKQYS